MPLIIETLLRGSKWRRVFNWNRDCLCTILAEGYLRYVVLTVNSNYERYSSHKVSETICQLKTKYNFTRKT